MLTPNEVLGIVIIAFIVFGLIVRWVAYSIKDDNKDRQLASDTYHDERRVKMMTEMQTWLNDYVPRKQINEYREQIASGAAERIENIKRVLKEMHTKEAMTLNNKIDELNKEIWMLKNPPKYKKGDKIFDVVVTESICDEDHLRDLWRSAKLNRLGVPEPTPGRMWVYSGVRQSSGEAVKFYDYLDTKVFRVKRKKKEEKV